MSTVGFIGLGWMGSNFALRLLIAGTRLRVFDLVDDKVQTLVARGAVAARDVEELRASCDTILLSLPDSAAAVRVMEEQLLPTIRAGQVIIDLGTTEIPQTRRLATLLRAKGAHLLDCPVSGDPRKPLYIFAGGDAKAFERAKPLLQLLADANHLTYCGESGSGQIAKGVNQLSMGLVQAAWLETISFATRQGISAELIANAVGGETGWRAELAAHAARVAAGDGEKNDLKFAELPYFLNAAKAAGIDLPLTSALYEYCNPGPRNWRDNMNRPYVSFWHMLHQT